MNKALKQFEAWHKTKRGLVVFGVLELAVAYGLASRAIDTGSWWQYGLGLLFLIGGLQNIIKLIRKVIGVRPKTDKA